jgi:phytoene/squalene synthetase
MNEQVARNTMISYLELRIMASWTVDEEGHNLVTEMLERCERHMEAALREYPELEQEYLSNINR